VRERISWGNFDVKITDKEFVLGGTGYSAKSKRDWFGYQEEGVVAHSQKAKNVNMAFCSAYVYMILHGLLIKTTYTMW
jgi:hypothetical protein